MAPNKGKSFQVPTVPVVCEKTAPRAIHWLVAVFHSFKTHLNSVAIDTETGKNNLHVHLQSQLKVASPPSPPAKPQPPTPHPPGRTPVEAHPTTANSQIATLQAEIRVHLFPPPPQFSLQGINSDGSPTAVTNHPTWLVTALWTSDLPECFTSNLTYTSPLTLSPFPDNVIEAVKLKFGGASPFYLSVSRSRHLAVAATSKQGMVSKTFTFPPDPSVPKAHC
ncbi:hypothetical protein EDC04DRAFT_2906616 [Pisolithus marmoratus]|nr:hypothetical protein EDC04DRAFT_2906616 [Pisolithus marmoratus]